MLPLYYFSCDSDINDLEAVDNKSKMDHKTAIAPFAVSLSGGLKLYRSEYCRSTFE